VRLVFALIAATVIAMPASAEDSPRFQVDAAWPKPLPNDWIMGQAAGVAVDAQDHVWVIQRPRTLTDDEKALTLNPPPSNAGRGCKAPRPGRCRGRSQAAWAGPTLPAWPPSP
jgi:hypothetical protein